MNGNKISDRYCATGGPADGQHAAPARQTDAIPGPQYRGRTQPTLISERLQAEIILIEVFLERHSDVS